MTCKLCAKGWQLPPGSCGQHTRVELAGEVRSFARPYIETVGMWTAELLPLVDH